METVKYRLRKISRERFGVETRNERKKINLISPERSLKSVPFPWKYTPTHKIGKCKKFLFAKIKIERAKKK